MTKNAAAHNDRKKDKSDALTVRVMGGRAYQTRQPLAFLVLVLMLVTIIDRCILPSITSTITKKKQQRAAASIERSKGRCCGRPATEAGAHTRR